MAQRLKSSETLFYYVEENVVDKLSFELNNRYKFQKIIFVGIDENFKNTLKSCKNNQFFCIFLDKFEKKDVEDDISCIVCGNNKLIKYVKKIASECDINYILLLDNYLPLNNFCQSLSNDNIEYNENPIGIIIDKEKFIFNKDEFYFNFLMDLSLVEFYNLESKMNALFFYDKQSKNINNENYNIESVIEYIKNGNRDTEMLMEAYTKFSMKFMKTKSTILSFLANLTKNYNKNINYCYIQMIITEIISKLYLVFIKNINTTICDFVAIEKLEKNNHIGIKNLNSFDKKFDNEKFWFTLLRLSKNLVNIINNSINNLQNIKDIVCMNNVEEMFNCSKNIKLDTFKHDLLNNITKYDSNSLLQIINYFGCLNQVE